MKIHGLKGAQGTMLRPAGYVLFLVSLDMHRSILVAAVLILAGCGVEVAGTAAVAGKSPGDTAQQTKEARTQVQNALDAAALADRQRLEQAEKAVRP